MELWISGFVLVSAFLLANQIYMRSTTKRKSELIYNRAMSATGNKKIRYGAQYVELLRNSKKENEAWAGYNRGADVFFNSLSLKQVNEATRRQLYPHAADFVEEALRRWPHNDTWGHEPARKKLLGEGT